MIYDHPNVKTIKKKRRRPLSSGNRWY
jgi:hypothetical protein